MSVKEGVVMDQDGHVDVDVDLEGMDVDGMDVEEIDEEVKGLKANVVY